MVSRHPKPNTISTIHHIPDTTSDRHFLYFPSIPYIVPLNQLNKIRDGTEEYRPSFCKVLIFDLNKGGVQSRKKVLKIQYLGEGGVVGGFKVGQFSEFYFKFIDPKIQRKGV